MIDVNQIAFEIVALSGDARTIILKALEELKLHHQNKSVDLSYLDNINSEIKKAEQLINECHVKQTDLLQAEAAGQKHDISFLMVHAQDHLMTTILLKELFDTFYYLLTTNKE